MYSRALPRPLDFFPHTRRGHGCTHDKYIPKTTDLNPRWERVPCVADACCLKRRQDGDGKAVKGELHDDQASNVKDWKQEHGFSEDVAIEKCTSRETGRL